MNRISMNKIHEQNFHEEKDQCTSFTKKKKSRCNKFHKQKSGCSKFHEQKSTLNKFHKTKSVSRGKYQLYKFQYEVLGKISMQQVSRTQNQHATSSMNKISFTRRKINVQVHGMRTINYARSFSSQNQVS